MPFPFKKKLIAKRLLIIEFILLFIGIPIGLFYFIHHTDGFLIVKRFLVPVFLSVISLFVLLYLWLDKSFLFNRLLKIKHFWIYFKEISFFFIPTAIVSLGLTYFVFPDDLFFLPKENPTFWLIIMVFYPLFSVLPQGVLYRVFFFHRYRFLFPKKWSMIVASAILFMFAHIIFNNIYALTFTLIGGFFFAFRYQRTNSLLLSSLEHALYGNWLFTVGLGKFLVAGLNS